MLFDAKFVCTAFMSRLNSPLMICSVSHIRQMLVLRSESHLTVKSPKTNGFCVNIRQLYYTVFRGNGMKFVKVSMETKYKKKCNRAIFLQYTACTEIFSFCQNDIVRLLHKPKHIPTKFGEHGT